MASGAFVLPLVMFGPVARVVGARWWWLLDKTAIATRSGMVMLVVRSEETATWDGVAALVGVLIFLGVWGADGLIFGGVSSGDVMGSGLGGGVIEFSKLTGLVVVEFSPDPLAPCWLSLSSTLFGLSEKKLDGIIKRLLESLQPIIPRVCHWKTWV
jgi:hypothetical protein